MALVVRPDVNCADVNCADVHCAEAVRQGVERRLRDALMVKVEPLIVPAGFFEAPGAKKVVLTLREVPELPASTRRGPAYAGRGDA